MFHHNNLFKENELNEKRMNRKVLVTGGAGYVGSALVQKLINMDYSVRVLDVMLFGSRGLEAVRNRCEIIRGDIRNSELVEKCLDNVDSVIHLAAISNDPCSDLDPDLTRQVNLEATKDLVHRARDHGVKRFIFASTSSVYGIKEESEVTENLALEPITVYSKTKALSEEEVLNCNSKDFATVVVRPATLCGYSPRQRLDLTVNILTSHAITRGEITVFGGEQKRPNLHIDDMTDLYINLLSVPEEKIAGEVFNFGDRNYKISEIAEIVRGIVDPRVTIKTIPNTNDPRSYSISSKKIHKTLGIYPKKHVEDAVTDLKNAFASGLIPDSASSVYRNVERMREINFS